MNIDAPAAAVTPPSTAAPHVIARKAKLIRSISKTQSQQFKSMFMHNMDTVWNDYDKNHEGKIDREAAK